MITIVKKDISKPFGNINVSMKVLGKATKEGFWPRQIITPSEEEKTVA